MKHAYIAINDINGKVIGTIEASNPLEAWEKARHHFGEDEDDFRLFIDSGSVVLI